MSKWSKLRTAIMSAESDNNIDFADLCGFVVRLGFEERVRGSHHIFNMPGITAVINLQPEPDGKAKAYQVRQVRNVVNRLGL